MSKTFLVITTIASSEQQVLKKLATESSENNVQLIIIGDVKSPKEFDISGSEFYSIDQQESLNFCIAEKMPKNHYARKNLGYLIAMSRGAEIIIETDDDNQPLDLFWSKRERNVQSLIAKEKGWLNIYQYFTDNKVWPRGFPLNKIDNSVIPFENLETELINSPIQQGLADGDPDVDAVYRLLYKQTIKFRKDRKVALSKGVWCPFNSQNTTWWREAFPLLYLPSYCSFRMTDIWRSFIAQRIAWENDWKVLFHEPTTFQERNEHDLMKDFNDEIPGYLNNNKICNELEKLPMKKGMTNIYTNLQICYEKLIALKILSEKELILLNLWIKDCNNISSQ